VAGSSTGGTSQDLGFTLHTGTNRVATSPWGSYSYDANGNQTSRPDGETVTYTAFDLPKQITGPRAATFLYDASGRRAQKSKSASDYTLYIGDLYEKRVNGTAIDHVFYVVAPRGVVAQVMRREGGSESTRYLHADHLESIDAVTDAAGAVVESTKRDPFGNKVTNFNQPTLPTTITASTNKVRLGFTGHEQDDELGLVNMRGRMYDPRLGRFLTPDPLIGRPINNQAYNRYAYVINSPLKFVDPSGYLPMVGDPQQPVICNEWGCYPTVAVGDGTGTPNPDAQITLTQEPQPHPVPPPSYRRPSYDRRPDPDRPVERDGRGPGGNKEGKGADGTGSSGAKKGGKKVEAESTPATTAATVATWPGAPSAVPVATRPAQGVGRFGKIGAIIGAVIAIFTVKSPNAPMPPGPTGAEGASGHNDLSIRGLS
jgi:RHS repeat-associated protein